MTVTKARLARLCVALSILWSFVAVAQDVNNELVGLPDNGYFHGSDIETVQVNNGNLHVDIPVWSAKGRGIDTTYHFIYDSKGWSAPESCDQLGDCWWTVTAEKGNTMILAGYGPTNYQLTSKVTNLNCNNVYRLTYQNVVLREPDGTKHHFTPDPFQKPGSPYCAGYPAASTLYADDGSGWSIQTSNWTATSKHGMQVINAGIIDSNGNQLTSTDTLGRPINSNGSYYDSSGTLRNIVTATTTVSIQTNLCPIVANTPCNEYQRTWTVPQKITLPNGQVYSFTYTQNGYGEIASITLPNGGQISYTYGNTDEGGPWITSRTVQDGANSGTWMYTAPGGHGYNVITDPAGNDTNHICTYPAGTSDICYEQFVRSYQGSYTSGALIRTVQTDYQSVQMYGGSNYAAVPIRETTTWNQYNLVSKTETDWDYSTQLHLTWKNPVEQRFYDWGTGAPGNLLKRAHYSYLHLDNPGTYLVPNIADRPTTVITYDGQSNIVAQSATTYDGSTTTNTNAGTCAAPQGAPNHDYCSYSNTNNVRGNPTQISVWNNQTSSWYNTVKTYDDLGNVLSSTDPLGNVTSYDYTDNFTDGTNRSTYAYLTKTTKPITNGVLHINRLQYFFYTGLTAATCGENFQLSSACTTGLAVPQADYQTFSYDLSNRLVSKQFGDGGQNTYCYTDQGGPTCSQTSPPYQLVATQLIAPAVSKISTYIADGLGRLSEAQLNGAPGGTVYIDYTYDNFGRKYTVTNPHRSGDSPVNVTTYGYDPLSRVTSATQSSDGSAVTTSYAANCTTFTDEAGHPRKSCADGLGRLSGVWEPDPNNASSFIYQTNYQYDALGNLTCVEQHGNTSSTGCSSAASYDSTSTWRVRRFTYDSLSRLLTAKNPESGTISYSYDADGNVHTKQDARGVTTTFAYDALNRLTSKSYTDGTPQAYYEYDQTSLWGSNLVYTTGRLTHAAVNTSTQSLRAETIYSYDSMGRVTGEAICHPDNCGTGARGLGATYNFAGLLSSVTYSSGRVVKYQYTTAGWLNGVTFDNFNGTPVNYPYLTVSTYNANGTPNSSQFGNGDWEYVYLNPRFQTAELKLNALVGGGTQTVADRIYSYGTTTNNGNVLSVTDNLWNSVHADNARTQYFNYDALNRLCSASEGPSSLQSGSCLLQNSSQPGRWAYNYSIDAWGNLWQKTHTKSTGADFSAPPLTNNQLTGMTYDAAGNDTNNGVSFTYDAENRMTTNGTGATYVYDADGMRVQKNYGGVTTNYVYLAKEVIAEITGNGNETDYIYAGGQRIAKADSFHYRVHTSGTNCSNCGWQYSMFYNNAFLQGYVIQPQDTVYMIQYQAGTAHGGFMLNFTDGTNSNWLVNDQDGNLMNSDNTTGTWHYRHIDLSSLAGKTINNTILVTEGTTTAGAWDIYYRDIVIVSADGSVHPVFTDEPSLNLAITGSSGSTRTYAVELDQTTGTYPQYTTNYYHGDHLGSSRLMTNGQGYPVWQATYMPYGEEVENLLTTNARKFTGKERDTETGLDNFGARYNASNMGRFMTPDPFNPLTLKPRRFQAWISNPQRWNKYAYALNNPTNLIDPDGMNACGTKDDKNCIVRVFINDRSKDKNGNYNDQFKNVKNQANYNATAMVLVTNKETGTTTNAGTFLARTEPSDTDKFPTTAANGYSATLTQHNGHLALRLQPTDHIPIANETNPAHPDRDYAQGILVHISGLDNYTGMTRAGGGVSEGCLLVCRSQYPDFLNAVGATARPPQRQFSVILSGTPNMQPGVEMEDDTQ